MLIEDHPIKVEAKLWADQALVAKEPSLDGIWAAAGEQGVFDQMIPQSCGGRDRGAIEAMLVFEGLGAGAADFGLVFALAAQTFVVQRAIALGGNAEQHERWLSPLMSGVQIGCFAMTEHQAGSDVAAITTSARLQADGSYLLNGSKAWVTLGPVSDLAVVFAVTDPDRGLWGMSAFVVDTHGDGVIRGPAVPKVGLQSCPFGDLTFADHRVAAAAMLGRPGAGFALFNRTVEAERAFLYAAQIGAMERVLDSTIERARTRRQFGNHIGAFQAVSHRIADMKLDHEMARLLLYKAAACHDRGLPISLPAAMTKLHTSLAAPRMALDAMRSFGAMGHVEATGLGRDLADATAGFSYAGTSDVTRNLVAWLLGLDRPDR